MQRRSVPFGPKPLPSWPRPPPRAPGSHYVLPGHPINIELGLPGDLPGLVLVVQHKHVGVRVVRGSGGHHGILRAHKAAQLQAQFAATGRIVGRMLVVGGFSSGVQAGTKGL